MTTTHTSLVARTAYFGTEQLSAAVPFSSRVIVCGIHPGIRLETALNVNFDRGPARSLFSQKQGCWGDEAGGEESGP